MASDNLAEENKRLRTRVSVLEHELKQRTAECTKFRDELRSLEELKEKNASQRELIAALRGELDFARAAQVSAVEALEKVQRETRDREHRERINNINARLGPDAPSPQSKKSSQASSAPNTASVGGVVPTSCGPQIVLKSSNISSLGFAPVQRPVDFLGGGPNPFQRRDNASGGSGGDDETEAGRLMAMAKDEALMDIQYAEREDAEERELRERFEALRRR